MPQSNAPEIGDISYQLKAGGSELANTIEVVSISVDRAINRIGSATIVMIDGDPSEETFSLSENESFKPGTDIEILAGYESDNNSIFKGIIVSQSVSADPDFGSLLTVECRDQAVKMTVTRKNKVYLKSKDQDAMTDVIKLTSGLSPTVADTTATHEQIVQYYATDWDFLVSRAQMNGLVVTTDDDKVTVADPSKGEASGFTATYGQNIFSISAEMDSASQLPSVTTSSWDSKTQAVITEKASNTDAGPGDLSSSDLSSALSLDTYNLQGASGVPKAALQDWGKGIMSRASASKIQGFVKIQGDSDVEVGQTIKLAGMGKHFNGDHYVSGVFHELEEGDWMSTLNLGISPESLSETTELAAPLASGMQPGVSGIVEGTVKKIVEDPNEAFRILVDAPILASDTEGIWARMLHPYASKNAGYFFLPEIDDEVALGFFNDDPNFPVILGSLYSNDKIKPFVGESEEPNLKPDLKPNSDNSAKAIVTKSGLRVTFEDVKKIITVATPGDNYMVFNDDAGSITIKDQNKNEVVMDSSGISMTSPGDITIKADKKVAITGSMGVTVDSDQSIASKAPKIEETADAQFNVTTGLGKVEASGTLTLKGAMVMIN